VGVLGSPVIGLGRVGGRVLWLVVVAVVWLLALGGSAAWATVGHTFAGEFGGFGSGDGQFEEPFGNGPPGVAVMPSTGEIFTVETGQRVQRFSADGVFETAFATDPAYYSSSAVAVDPVGSGAVYVATVRVSDNVPAVVKYSTVGVFAYALDVGNSGTTINSNALAVDPVDGTVYVTATDSSGLPVVDRFDGSTGALIDSFDGAAGSPDGPFSCSSSSLAVDGSHRVYVLDPCKNGSGRVDQFSAAGVFGATIDDGSRGVPRAVAADPVSGEVYVAENDATVGLQITHFSAGGGVVYTFDAADATDVRGMAVSGVGTVYTSDAARPFVERFTRFDGPTVVTGGTSSLGSRSVVLEGTINPEGVSSRYHFEYGTDLTYGHRSPEVGETGAGNGSTPVAASAEIDGLEPNKLYYFRLVGSNDAGSIAGASVPFTTALAPPDVGGSGFASAITPDGANLHGTVNPNNSIAIWHFEYGTTTAYGSSPFGGFLFSGGTFQAVVSPVSALVPGTLYHFRLVASDVFGTSQYGADQTFYTAPAAGGGATAVTAGRATLTGMMNPHGVATSYHFNYGPSADYGSSTPEVDGGSGDGDRLVSQAITGLLPDRTYHVQVIATSADGVVRSGGDGVFRTALAPTAAAIAPTGISTDAATLTGDVNTFGSTGSYHFDVWSLDSTYAISTPERPVAGNASAERVSAALTGLPAGETFVVQLSVSSNDAVGVSDLNTFATAAAPRVFASPPASDGASLYGCGLPRLAAYSSRPKPGEMIMIAGEDLGVGGNVVLGDRSLKAVDWSPAGFKVLVPDDASGTLGLTVNCGHLSNTIAVAVFQQPDNRFSVTGRSVAGSTATLKVRVPGPGKLESFGSGTKAAAVTIKKPATATIKVKLTSAGVKSLNRAPSHTRRVGVRVRFTPAGGRSASKTVAITFKRQGAR
jgi:sugar lactone lactonase YvrE